VPRPLVVEIVGDASKLNRAIGRAEATTDGFGKKLGNLGKVAAGAAGAAGIGALIFGLKAGISEYQQNQKEAAILNAVLKSTGHSANVTAKHVTDLSTALMKKTGIDDEAIQTGQNLLLTFTNIRNEVGKGNNIFDQATTTVTDLSVALGQDFKQSALQVGKALQDPTRGLTALRRVGVAFTEDQMKQIKALDASGHKIEAQKMILRELNKEFGGAAEAVGQTLPGQLAIARESFNNFAGDLVAKAIPAIKEMITWVREHWPEISAVIKRTWNQDLKPTIMALVDLIRSVVIVIRNNWGTIGPIVRAFAQIVETNLKVVIGIIRTLSALLRGDWSQAWAQAKATVFAFIDGIKARVALMLAIGKGLANALVSGFTAAIKAGWDLVKKAITGLFDQVIGWAKDALGISSPSRVFHGIGQNLVKGFIHGVGSMGGALKKAVLNLVKSLPAKAVGAVTGLLHGGGATGSQQNRNIGQKIAAGWGWGSGAEWAALDALAMGESGWSNTAKNKSSGAYGIAQALPESKYPPAGRQSGGSDAATQVSWMLGYIKSRYGDPIRAYQAWQSRSPHWYDKGGIVPGRGPQMAVVHGGETILPTHRGGTMQVNLQLDGRTLASVLIDPLRNEARLVSQRTGRPVFSG